MRTKRRAIIKLSFILLAIVIGALAVFLPIKTQFRTWKGFAQGIKLGIDLKGGAYAVYQAAEDEDTANLDTRLDSTVDRLSTVLGGEGYSEATIVREGSNRIRVEVPDVSDPEELFDLMGEPAVLEFRLYEEDNSTFIKTLAMTGKNVVNAQADLQDGNFGVSVQFDSAGRTEFAEVTSQYVNHYLWIMLNDEAITKATIQSAIPDGRTFISGSFSSLEDADRLAKQILAGAFDVRLTLLESGIMDASLGTDALLFGLIAGAIALVLIIAYLCAIYRGMGIVSGIALLAYTVILIFLLWAFPWVQLSLPGIAGIILSLGMAVDANVIIFERIREEYAAGKSINASVAAGFKKSLWTVLDANITTVLAAIVLIILGTGTVRGFGITLLMGIIVSLLTALLISRGLFKLMLQINKSNANFYGLHRDEGVEEIPDEVKPEPVESDAIALDPATGLPPEAVVEGGEEA